MTAHQNIIRKSEVRLKINKELVSEPLTLSVPGRAIGNDMRQVVTC